MFWERERERETRERRWEREREREKKNPPLSLRVAPADDLRKSRAEHVAGALEPCGTTGAAKIINVPVNMPDPIRKRSVGYGQLRPLRPAYSQNRAGSYVLDPTSRILFSSVFPKKAWAILCKTDPDPIWMTWLNSSGLKASSVVTFSDRSRSSTDVPDNIVQNQPGSDLVLADCARSLAKRIRSWSKPVNMVLNVHRNRTAY